MKNIGIIGGGIIGLCTAYYLKKAGHRITILDQGTLKEGCSFGNAGMIVPSHVIPLAAPGMISKGIRWMFSSKSPFYVKPRWNRSLITWGYHFYKSATKEHVARSIPALKEISLLSRDLYAELARELPFDFGYRDRGLLMLYKQADTEKEERETAELANRNGIEAHVLSAVEVQKLEPEVKVDVRGGVYFPGDAHLIPQDLVTNLISLLKERGVLIYENTPVNNFEVWEKNIVRLQSDEHNFSFDEVVLAGGAWSGIIAAGLGISLPMQAGKGYSFTVQNIEKNIRIPSIFLEARVAVTPMADTIRFGGTMEISGIDPTINMSRVAGIADSISAYYPEMNVTLPDKSEIWHGFRPCSPDGLPYIGRSRTVKNLIIATGHAMMGLSLAPATGHLVTEIVCSQKASMDLQCFDPERF
jgi:D-amino-acid dehydrogenase